MRVSMKSPGSSLLATLVVLIAAPRGGDARTVHLLEVRVLTVELPHPYGYNGCSGFIPANCPNNARVSSASTWMEPEFLPGIVIPLRPFFGSTGVAPPPDAGRWSSNPPWVHAVDLRITQLVDGFVGEHAMIPKAIFKGR